MLRVYQIDSVFLYFFNMEMEKIIANNIRRLETRPRDWFRLKKQIEAQVERERKKLVDSPPGTPSSVSSVEVNEVKTEVTVASPDVEAKQVMKKKPKEKPKEKDVQKESVGGKKDVLDEWYDEDGNFVEGKRPDLGYPEYTLRW